MKRIQRACLGIAVAALLALAGCAAPNLYSINMGYDAKNATIPSYLKPTPKALESIVRVAEFVDTRNTEDRLVIGKVIEKNGMKVLVLPKTVKPTRAFAQGVRSYLRKADYNVSGIVEQWDLQEATIVQSPASKVLIGGAIEAMEIDCRRSFPTNTYTTKIRLTLYLADTIQKKILYRETVEATTLLEHVVFSEGRMSDQAGMAMGDAIEKLFEKRQMAQKIAEVLDR